MGIIREIARTGTAHTGADQYGSTTPTAYFGKGLGDLPIAYLRPLAITGTIGYTIADKKLKALPGGPTDLGANGATGVTGLATQQFNSGYSNRLVGGLSVQYSLPYLHTQVRDLGAPDFFNRLIPIVEIAYSSPASKPSNLGTQVVRRARRHLQRRQLPGRARGVDSGQPGVGPVCRRDRTSAPVLRRPVSEQPRQAAVPMIGLGMLMHARNTALTLVLALGLAPGVAHAHAQLHQASPAVGATVRVAPAQVELTFTEGVEPRFSSVVVTGPGDAQVDKQDLHLVAGDAKHVAISLGPLSPGSYRVVWHATSVDTHKTEGSFTFTVAP